MLPQLWLCDAEILLNTQLGRLYKEAVVGYFEIPCVWMDLELFSVKRVLLQAIKTNYKLDSKTANIVFETGAYSNPLALFSKTNTG